MSADQPVTLTDQERERVVREVEQIIADHETGSGSWMLAARAIADLKAEWEAAAFERGRQAAFGEAEDHLHANMDEPHGDRAASRVGELRRRAVLPPVPVDAHTSNEQETLSVGDRVQIDNPGLLGFHGRTGIVVEVGMDCFVQMDAEPQSRGPHAFRRGSLRRIAPSEESRDA